MDNHQGIKSWLDAYGRVVEIRDIQVGKIMGRVWLLLILTTLVLSVSPTPAYACSCAQIPAPLEFLEESAAVFSGRVLNVEGIPLQNDGIDIPVKVTFQVSKVWKGPSDGTLVVETSLEGASCGLGRTFRINEEYLVYAFGEESELRTNLCTRTTEISNAQEDLAELNLLGMPSRDFQQFNLGASYVILGAIAVIAVVILVRRSGK